VIDPTRRRSRPGHQPRASQPWLGVSQRAAPRRRHAISRGVTVRPSSGEPTAWLRAEWSTKSTATLTLPLTLRSRPSWSRGLVRHRARIDFSTSSPLWTLGRPGRRCPFAEKGSGFSADTDGSVQGYEAGKVAARDDRSAGRLAVVALALHHRPALSRARCLRGRRPGLVGRQRSSTTDCRRMPAAFQADGWARSRD